MKDKMVDYANAFAAVMREKDMEFSVNRRSDITSFTISSIGSGPDKLSVKLTIEANHADLSTDIADKLSLTDRSSLLTAVNSFNDKSRFVSAAISEEGNLSAAYSVLLSGDENQACIQLFKHLILFTRGASEMKARFRRISTKRAEEKKALDSAEIVPLDVFYDV